MKFYSRVRLRKLIEKLGFEHIGDFFYEGINP
jgi:hypothetical protein